MTPATALIEKHLAEHGVRRFEPGARGGYDSIKSAMASYGYAVSMKNGRYQVKMGSGRPRSMNYRQLVALYDEIRIVQGMEPIIASSKKTREA